MKLPTPDDMGCAPIWEIYIVAQAVQASLGLIPKHAHAIGVEVAGTNVHLLVQLTEASMDDLDDIDEIVSELQILVGDHVTVQAAYEVRQDLLFSPTNDLYWIFLARAERED